MRKRIILTLLVTLAAFGMTNVIVVFWKGISFDWRVLWPSWLIIAAFAPIAYFGIFRKKK